MKIGRESKEKSANKNHVHKLIWIIGVGSTHNTGTLVQRHTGPIKMIYWTNDDLLLSRCLRRWPNLKASLAQCPLYLDSIVQAVFALSKQIQDGGPMLPQCWSTVYDAGLTLRWHWLIVSCLLVKAPALSPIAYITHFSIQSTTSIHNMYNDDAGSNWTRGWRRGLLSNNKRRSWL